MGVGTHTGTRSVSGRWVTAAVVLIVATTGLRVASDDKVDRADRDANQRFKELKEHAAAHVIERESEPPVRLTLVAEPALRWNNPVRVAYDGAVFVWVADGRPEAVASFYRNVERGVAWEHHEFQSLSESSLTAKVEGRTVWAPRSAGVALKPIAGASEPAENPEGRLRQMRALARDFHAGYGNEQKSSGLSLRLLTRPLHRYSASKPSEPDGAVFAFVQATDPEVVLVLEARPANGVSAWHYSLARMCGRGLRAWYKDELVWEAPTMYGGDFGAPYTNSAEAIPSR